VTSHQLGWTNIPLKYFASSTFISCPHRPLPQFCETRDFCFAISISPPNSPDTWKTVSDAWNGFHSVLLYDLIDSWQHSLLHSDDGNTLKLHKGLLVLGMAITVILMQCYQNLSERNVWQTTLSIMSTTQWTLVENYETFEIIWPVWHRSKLIQTISTNFAGFCIFKSTVESLPKYSNFPTLSSTDIRSWFGLVNQVSI